MTTTSDVPQAWLDDEIAHARSETELLRHELTRLREELHQQRQETERLHEAIAVLEGRTWRHEAGQDLVRAGQHDLSGLHEQLAGEAALRRDQIGALDRARERDHEAVRALAQELRDWASRTASVEQSAAATRDVQQGTTAAIELNAQQRNGLQQGVDELVRQIAVLRDLSQRDGDALLRHLDAIDTLRREVAELAARQQSQRAAQARTDEAVAVLQARETHEQQLSDLVEQQRAVRTRLEERFAAVEARMEALARDLVSGAEERAALGRLLQGVDERVRRTGDVIEEQRLALIEQARTLTLANEQAVRRQMADMERQVRGGRELLARLAEQSRDTGRDALL